ncbi:argininosuccinate lyase [Streptomyces sp. NPDC003042]
MTASTASTADAGTGRLTQLLGARTRRVVYGEPGPEAVRRELEATSTVDLAHVVMLGESGLLPGPAAAALLERVRRLRESGFAELTGREAPRGLYLMYEGYLVEELGSDIGGKVHTARSRNDIKATVTAMRLRGELTDLLGEILRLQAVLLSRARRHQGAVMPVYTHFQPAMPISYGYYLAGIATALDRDITALRHTVDDLDRCPLGAGAVAGTDLPIRPERTAALLGFRGGPTLHATDAVASRDTMLRGLAVIASAAVTLSRLATDLQLWSTQEFGFVEFPERLVGGSSAMPQKRNAFLLEHVKAKAAWAVGAWTASASASKSTPFTNSIEVGTEAVAVAWPALVAVRESVLLAQVLVSGARPVTDRMEQRAREGFVTATVIANRLVGEGVPFRTAHHVVGAAVRDAIASGEGELTKIETPDGVADLGGALPTLADVVADLDRGGGPGECAAIVTTLRDLLAGHGAWLTTYREGLRDAALRLGADVEAVIAQHGTGETP